MYVYAHLQQAFAVLSLHLALLFERKVCRLINYIQICDLVCLNYVRKIHLFVLQ